MERKPVVGVVPLVDAARESLWMLPAYLESLTECGLLPITLPLAEEAGEIRQMLALCDGVLITGGQDIDPALYGRPRSPQCGELCPQRDALEMELFRQALAAHKPVLGICRGLQTLNVALGGTLWQDLPSERPGPVCHAMKPPYDAAAHRVTVLEGSMLAAITGAGTFGVNSRHHQAIQDLAPRLQAQAISEDGLIEAVCVPGERFALAVQWHPEHSFRTDPRSRAVFAAFAAALKEKS